MTVTVYGIPGGRRTEVATKYGTASARRGAFYEGVTSRALERWLARRPGDFRLFHDLTGLQNVSGHGFAAMGLGAGNIDHVILDAGIAIMIDAKGIGAGQLTVDGQGHGILVRADGSAVPQPWMDTRRNFAHLAALHRLTGLPGHLVWLVPRAVDLDENTLHRARCFATGGTILTTPQLEPGLGDLLCGRPALPDLVDRLTSYTAPDHVRCLTACPWAPSELVELPA